MTSTAIEKKSEQKDTVDAHEVKQKLEAVFSKLFIKNGIDGDDYFCTILNYTPESTISVEQLKKAPIIANITTDDALLREAISNSRSLLVCNDLIKSSTVKHEQNTLILREISSTAPSGDIHGIFVNATCADGTPCPSPQSVRADMNDTWFVSFASEEQAKQALAAIRGHRYRDHPIRAGLKTESTFKSFYSNNSAPLLAPTLQQHQLQHQLQQQPVASGTTSGGSSVSTISSGGGEFPEGAHPPAGAQGHPPQPPQQPPLPYLPQGVPPYGAGFFQPGYSVPPPPPPFVQAPYGMPPGAMMGFPPQMVMGGPPMMPQQGVAPYVFMQPPFMQQQQQQGGYAMNSQQNRANRPYNNSAGGQNNNYNRNAGTMGGGYANNRQQHQNGQYRTGGSPRGNQNFSSQPSVAKSFSNDSSSGQADRPAGKEAVPAVTKGAHESVAKPVSSSSAVSESVGGESAPSAVEGDKSDRRPRGSQTNPNSSNQHRNSSGYKGGEGSDRVVQDRGDVSRSKSGDGADRRSTRGPRPEGSEGRREGGRRESQQQRQQLDGNKGAPRERKGREGGGGGRDGRGPKAEAAPAPKRADFNLEADFPVFIENSEGHPASAPSGDAKPVFAYANAVKKLSANSASTPVLAAPTPATGGPKEARGKKKDVHGEGAGSQVPEASEIRKVPEPSAEHIEPKPAAAAEHATAADKHSAVEATPQFAFGSFSAPIEIGGADDTHFGGPATTSAPPAAAAPVPVAVSHPFISSRPATQVSEVVAPKPVAVPVVPPVAPTAAGSAPTTATSSATSADESGGAWGGAKKSFVDILRAK